MIKIKLKCFFLILQISAIVSFTGCSSSYEETAFKFGVGKYKFVMSDSTGKTLAEGRLNVKSTSGNNISGTYDFTKIYENDFPGLSAMDGQFEGNIIPLEKKVFINTNPKIADSNVFWNMTIKKNSVSGEWTYSMFRGTGNKGKVKIYR